MMERPPQTQSDWKMNRHSFGLKNVCTDLSVRRGWVGRGLRPPVLPWLCWRPRPCPGPPGSCCASDAPHAPAAPSLHPPPPGWPPNTHTVVNMNSVFPNPTTWWKLNSALAQTRWQWYLYSELWIQMKWSRLVTWSHAWYNSTQLYRFSICKSCG